MVKKQDGYGIYSPTDDITPLFTEEEKSSIPHTRLRFVTYHSAKFFQCEERGHLWSLDYMATAQPGRSDGSINLKVAGDSTMTLHKLRKLYIKHKVKWKKLKVEKQPNTVQVSKDDRKR